jgi:hypothetical protein
MTSRYSWHWARALLALGLVLLAFGLGLLLMAVALQALSAGGNY